MSLQRTHADIIEAALFVLMQHLRYFLNPAAAVLPPPERDRLRHDADALLKLNQHYGQTESSLNLLERLRGGGGGGGGAEQSTLLPFLVAQVKELLRA